MENTEKISSEILKPGDVVLLKKSIIATTKIPQSIFEEILEGEVCLIVSVMGCSHQLLYQNAVYHCWFHSNLEMHEYFQRIS